MKRKIERKTALRKGRKRKPKKKGLRKSQGEPIPDVRAWRNIQGESIFTQGFHGTGVRVKREEKEEQGRRKRTRSLGE